MNESYTAMHVIFLFSDDSYTASVSILLNYWGIYSFLVHPCDDIYPSVI